MNRKPPLISVNAVGVKDAFAGIGHCTLYLFDALAQRMPETRFRIFVAAAMQERYTYTAPNISVVPVRLPGNSLAARILWDQLVCPLRTIGSRLLFSMMNAACVLALTRQITFIYDLADVRMPQRFSRLKTMYLKLFRFFTMRRSRHILTISRATKQDLLQFYPRFEDKIVVIPLGHKSMAPGRTRGAQAAHDTRLKQYFLFVSTIEPGKNLPRLLRAFKRFLAGHRGWQLVVAGARGWGYAEFAATMAAEGLEDAVVETGYVSDQELDSLFRRCKGFVFPSLYEGFGLPVLEAMQYKIPILTSNVSSLPEVGGKGVVYCDPLDEADIAAGLEKLLTQKRSRYARYYTQQLETYTWEKGARVMLGVVEESGDGNPG